MPEGGKKDGIPAFMEPKRGRHRPSKYTRFQIAMNTIKAINQNGAESSMEPLVQKVRGGAKI